MSAKTGTTLWCDICIKPLYIPGYKLFRQPRHYCSRACQISGKIGSQRPISAIIATANKNRGIKRSLETRLKMSAWQIGRKMSPEARLKMSQQRKGRKLSEETKLKISIFHKGKVISEETRRKISEAQKGEKAHNWQGGKTEEKERIRKSVEYKLWREAVYKRDNYTCVECGDNKGSNLQADHIKPFAYFPELRFDINNGRTLCISCHKKTPTYGWQLYNNRTRAQPYFSNAVKSGEKFINKELAQALQNVLNSIK